MALDEQELQEQLFEDIGQIKDVLNVYAEVLKTFSTRQAAAHEKLDQILDAVTKEAEGESLLAILRDMASGIARNTELLDAVTRADFAEDVKDQTPGVLKPDLSAAMAQRLGIDTSRPLTLGGMASLMAGLNAAGGEIEGKHRQSAMIAVGTVFGVPPVALPNAAELDHILAGRTVDGRAPETADGKPLPAHVVRGAQRRFRAAVGLPSDRQPNNVELSNVASGKKASGAFVDMDEYRRAVTATRQPIGFADLTFSASKSLSTAWGVAATDAERLALVDIHTRAVADTMRFMADQLGWARKGHAGRDGVERAELAWVSYQHYTSRPTVHVKRTDPAGNAYTDMREIPTLRADPNAHTHVILLNHAMVPETGRMTSVDFDRMKGLIHQGGQVYRAYEAKHGRALGIDVRIGEHGDAQMSDVDPGLQRLFSKRSQEADNAARVFAAAQDLDWDAIGEEQKIGLMRTAAAQTREAKVEGQVPDHDAWRQEAAEAGFVQKSVLGRHRVKPALSPDRRHAIAREVLQPMVEQAFAKSAIIDGDTIRALAARSMIVSGIGERAADDISAVTKLLRERGVRQEGQDAALVWDKSWARGKERTVVSTDKHLATEAAVITLAQAMAADRSTTLSPAAIDRAAANYLRQHAEIDPTGPWQQQVRWAHQLGEGGRLSIGFGAAGVGKSTVTSILAEAWRAEGRHVFGAVLSHSQVGDLAGIAIENKTAMDPFLRRAAAGHYNLDQSAVIVVDEVGLLGNKQMRTLLALGQKTGASVVMIGDPAQCRSPEAGDPLELIGRALPTAIPELVRSIRQKNAYELAVTQAFREDPATGLAMKIKDGSAQLIAGAPSATIERAVTLRRERLAANAEMPSYTLAIMAPTNATASAISQAIRADHRAHGEIGPDQIEIAAIDRTGHVRSLSSIECLSAIPSPGRSRPHHWAAFPIRLILRLLSKDECSGVPRIREHPLDKFGGSPVSFCLFVRCRCLLFV